MSSATRTMSSDTRLWEEQQEELRALSPFRRLMRQLNLEALVYESAPFPVLLRKLSALVPACLLWWVIYEPHRLASSAHLPEGTHAITLLPGAWGDPATGAYGGLPELPGVLLRWVLCIAAMVAVVHLCGVKAKGQSFTIPHDARSRLIALMQTLGIFGAFALVVWIEYMMTPLTLMFETVYAGPTAVYSGDGTFKGGKGSISFSGSVRFTGHHGILDTTIANPRLEINGNSGTLYATMNSNDSSGKATNYGEVALLKVDLSGLQSSADAVSVNGAATTLTAEGAKAFAGFYEAGKDMAPLSFSAAINGAKTTTKTVTETVYEGEGCDPVTGKPLASTGASGVEGPLVAGFIAVAAGAGTVVYTRRRKKA